MKTTNKLYLALCILALSIPAYSLETSLDLNLGLEHTDNGEKTEVDEISDTEQKAGFDLGLKHEGQNLQAELDYSIERNSYDKDTQEDNTDINGNLSVTFEPIKESLFLHLDSSTRNIVSDKAAIDVANNRQNRTISTIEPEWALRLSPANQLNLSVKYTDIQFEESDQGSDRSGASVSWTRQLSKVDAMSIQLNYTDIEFDIKELDYEYYQAYFGYAANLSKLQYSINIGYNESKHDNKEDVSGGFLDAEFNYTNAASTWSLELGREITDSSKGNNNGGFKQFSSRQGSSNDIDIYELTTLRASWKNTSICTACTINARISYEDEDYETIINDSEELKANVGVAYELTRSTKLSFDVSYTDINFTENENTRSDYDRVLARFSITRKLTRDLSFRIFAQHEERDSDVGFNNYKELIGGISLTYSFL